MVRNLKDLLKVSEINQIIIICIQETCSETALDLVIKGYGSIRRDKVEGRGGGCIIFVKQEMQYSVLKTGKEWEIIVIEVWTEPLQSLEEVFIGITGGTSCKFRCEYLVVVILILIDHYGIVIMMGMER